jgi:hypothetical protein
MYDEHGSFIGQEDAVFVPGRSTNQVHAVAEWLGIDGEIAPFTLRVDLNGLDAQAFATVIDNITGDSVLFMSSHAQDSTLWVVGVADAEGRNGSHWRTDVWLHNPTDGFLSGDAKFVIGDRPGELFEYQWTPINPHGTSAYLNVVGDVLGLEETRGYLVITGTDGGPLPQVAARTYNLDLAGGTYGLNLRTFSERDLLSTGDIGYVAGVSNSRDMGSGFRTNLGVVNTDEERWALLEVTFFRSDTSIGAGPHELYVAPGEYVQLNIFDELGLTGVDAEGSLKIEVLDGDGLAVFATEIENYSQDSIFIPAQPKFIGATP